MGDEDILNLHLYLPLSHAEVAFLSRRWDPVPGMEEIFLDTFQEPLASCCSLDGCPPSPPPKLLHSWHLGLLSFIPTWLNSLLS